MHSLYEHLFSNSISQLFLLKEWEGRAELLHKGHDWTADKALDWPDLVVSIIRQRAPSPMLPKPVVDMFHAFIQKMTMQTFIFSHYLHCPFKHFTLSHKYLWKVCLSLSLVFLHWYLKAHLSHISRQFCLCYRNISSQSHLLKKMLGLWQMKFRWFWSQTKHRGVQAHK